MRPDCHTDQRLLLVEQPLPGRRWFADPFRQPSPIRPKPVSLTGAYIPNQTLPYSETWTAGVQHIFANKYTLEVRYVELAESICRSRPV